VIVRDGEPVISAMHLERITLAEVKDAARAQGIADLGEVKLCILEPGGSFSFLKNQPDDDGQAGNQPTKKTR
jgi:uncharacterized membrane protein YcaP (DUF421 family)